MSVPQRPSWKHPSPPGAAVDPAEVPDPSGVDLDFSPPKPQAPPPEQPAEIAKRLAQEARERLAAQKAAAPPSAAPKASPAAPPPPASPPAAGLSAAAPPPKAARPAAPPPPPARNEDDYDTQRDLGDGPDPVVATAEDFGTLDDGAPVPPPAPLPGLAARKLPPPPGKKAKVTAAEALASALQAEQAPAATPQPRPRKAAPSLPPRSAAPPAPAPEAQAAPAPARPPARKRAGDPTSIVRDALPGAEVIRQVPVTKAEVFRALWSAHRARAQHEGDATLAVTATLLLDTVDRAPLGTLLAVRVRHGDAEWAGWIDLTRGVLVGVARPADIYLAGL